MSLWKKWVFCVTRKVKKKKKIGFKKANRMNSALKLLCTFFPMAKAYSHAMFGRAWIRKQVVGSWIVPTEENHSKPLLRATD